MSVTNQLGILNWFNDMKMLISAACCLIFCANLFADDQWSMFRGPNGSGTANTALPDQLDLKKNLVWKSKIARGYSSPVFWGDKIFLTAEEDGQLLTICVDRKTGQQLWRGIAERDRKEKLDFRNHPAAASAAVDKDSVVVFFGDYGLISYAHDGTKKWQLPLGPFNNIYGMGASPIIVDDMVVLVCDQNTNSFVIAVNKTTGKIAWKTARPEATSGHCTPIFYRPAADRPAQILIAGSFNLTAYAAETGKKIWWVGGLCFEMKSTPVIADGLLFINGYGSPYNQPDQKVTVDSFANVLQQQDENNNGKLEKSEMPDDLARNFFSAVDLDGDQSLVESEWKYFAASLASENSMMAISLGGSGDVTSTNLKWKYHKNIPQLPSPVVVGDRLYMISDRGIVTIFDASTGAVETRGRLNGASGNVYASPVVAETKILFLTTEGKLAIVSAGDELKVDSVLQFGEKCFATPAVVDGRLYVRTDDSLFCLGE